MDTPSRPPLGPKVWLHQTTNGHPACVHCGLLRALWTTDARCPAAELMPWRAYYGTTVATRDRGNA